MSVVINRTTKQVIQSADANAYLIADWVIYTRTTQAKLDAFRTLNLTVPAKYIKFDGSDNASEMTAGEKVTADAAIASAAATVAAAKNLVDRTSAINRVASLVDVDAKVARAVIAVAIDEINILREWVAAFKVEVAAAASLADLKTRVATLPATPDRTLAQAKTAITNKINAGTVD